MFYRLAADFVVFLHFVFILFVIFGALLAFWRRWIVFLHVPAAVYGALIEFCGWICPLTPLENRLRAAAGDAGYSGGFIERYLMPLIYPDEYTLQVQLACGIFVVVINIALYGLLLYRLSSGKNN